MTLKLRLALLGLLSISATVSTDRAAAGGVQPGDEAARCAQPCCDGCDAAAQTYNLLPEPVRTAEVRVVEMH